MKILDIIAWIILLAFIAAIIGAAVYFRKELFLIATL